MSTETPYRHNPKHTFVLRMWLENSGEPGDDAEWRGEVRDVASNDVAHFRHLDGLAAAVRQLGLDGR